MGYVSRKRGGKCRLSLNPNKRKSKTVYLPPSLSPLRISGDGFLRPQNSPHTPRSRDAAAALLDLSVRTPRGRDAAESLAMLGTVPTGSQNTADNNVIFSPSGQHWVVAASPQKSPNKQEDETRTLAFTDTKRVLDFSGLVFSYDQSNDMDVTGDGVAPLQDVEDVQDVEQQQKSVAVQTDSLQDRLRNKRTKSVEVQTDNVQNWLQKQKKSVQVQTENLQVQEKSLYRTKVPQHVIPRREILSYTYLVCQTQLEFRRLTGMYQPQFLTLLDFLDRDVGDVLKYRSDRGTPKKKKTDDPAIPCELRLLITLLRMRRGWDVQDLALFFGLSTYTISTTISTWVQFMYVHFKRMEKAMFASRHLQTRQERPPAFKPYDNFRVVLDTTEIVIQSPENLDQQGNTYSDYKSGNVWLYLLGISCWGGVSFLSRGFEGSMTDVEIYRRSGIREFLERGDVILADRGFTIEEECDEDGVIVLHPPFLRGRSHFTPEEETMTKEVAKSRIFVEHLVRKIKIFHLFKKISNNMLHYLDDLVYVAGCLVNFLPCHIHSSKPNEEQEKKNLESSSSSSSEDEE